MEKLDFSNEKSSGFGERRNSCKKGLGKPVRGRTTSFLTGIPTYSKAREVLLLELMGGVATCDSATCFLGVSVYSNAGEVLL